MTPIITKLISNTRLIAVILIVVFTAIFGLLRLLINKKNEEINRLNNNILYYQSLLDSTVADRRVLRLKLDDYKQSNDSLIREIKNVLKVLKIKDKHVLQALIQEQVIKYDTTIVVKHKDFELVVKPNSLTTILINKTDSLLLTTIDIRNTLTLIVTKKKEYKRQYKNFIKRILHLDFKKTTSIKYQINNSNDLIKIESTRLIEIED